MRRWNFDRNEFEPLEAAARAATGTDLASGHDAEKDGKACDRRRQYFECVYGPRCPDCPESRLRTIAL